MARTRWRHTSAMPHTHRQRVHGATFFFTVRLQDAGSTLLTDQIAAFAGAMRQVRLKNPFHVDAWVVLPDHLHAIWTLPPGDFDYPQRWTGIKIGFSKALRKADALPEGAIWARRYRDLEVADNEEYRVLVDYVHLNPLRHGYCTDLAQWPWSSLHRHLAAGFALPAAGGNER
jgi:putative transposase